MDELRALTADALCELLKARVDAERVPAPTEAIADVKAELDDAITHGARALRAAKGLRTIGPAPRVALRLVA
jgi:hypothetical protein